MAMMGWWYWIGIGIFVLVGIALAVGLNQQTDPLPRLGARVHTRLVRKANWQKFLGIRHSPQGTIILPRGVIRLIWKLPPLPRWQSQGGDTHSRRSFRHTK